jgi:4-amino-4-deoxy-L-arabinose transferase-like glycosyltransferase
MDNSPRPCNHSPVTRSLPAPLVALIFCAASLLSRLATLPRSVLDWDESLYFLMASQWRAGHLPYTTIWDNKPIGIYAIFAGFQSVFGGDVFAIRIATVLCVGLLGFAVFRITEILTGNRNAAWVAGAALLLGSLSNDGLSANTELFMACATSFAVLAALTTQPGVIVGLLLGCAFMIKYVSVFEMPAVFFLAMFLRRRVWPSAMVALGAAIPLVLVMLLYAAAGKFPLWLECSVFSNFRRAGVVFQPGVAAGALALQAWRWGGLFLAGFAIAGLAAWRRGWREVFLAGWLLGGLVGAASASAFYDHYFLQVLPVLCVISGVWFACLPQRLVVQAGFILAVLALPAWAARNALLDTTGPDVPRLVSADLRDAGAARIYDFDSEPIIYALTGENPPTPYVLPSVLTGVFLPRVAGVDAAAEVARILAQRPDFIIRRDYAPDPARTNAAVYALMDQALAQYYSVWRRYPGVAVYRLN